MKKKTGYKMYLLAELGWVSISNNQIFTEGKFLYLGL